MSIHPSSDQEKIYHAALALKDIATTSEEYSAAGILFKKLGAYSNSERLANDCELLSANIDNLPKGENVTINRNMESLASSLQSHQTVLSKHKENIPAALEYSPTVPTTSPQAKQSESPKASARNLLIIVAFAVLIVLSILGIQSVERKEVANREKEEKTTALIQKGDYELNQWNFVDAIAYYKEAVSTSNSTEAIDKLSSAESIYTEAKAASKRSYDAAEALLAAGDFEGAKTKFKSIQAFDTVYYEKAQQHLSSITSQQYFSIAEQKDNDGDLVGAIANYNLVPEDVPDLYAKSQERILSLSPIVFSAAQEKHAMARDHKDQLILNVAATALELYDLVSKQDEKNYAIALVESGKLRSELFNSYLSLAKASYEHNAFYPAVQYIKSALKMKNDPEAKDLEIKYTASLEKAQAAQQAEKDAAAQAALNKQTGVHIGMTKEEVLGSSWGKPDEVNKTTTIYGVSEQWVYGYGNYLYFEDGILTTIQN